ncbi:hypothetical protein NDU88_002739 [Pleurodeles waltl]|uniref:Uncharacterized protein n=1 Tax=Pleurodeles waltl TaxID=8319 RepID=A0AAV7QAR7_PLEWA|nr:hypothetical protein NDU88_002739 [Pleurodeles waltl]
MKPDCLVLVLGPRRKRVETEKNRYGPRGKRVETEKNRYGPAVLVSATGLHRSGSQRLSALPKSGCSVFRGSVLRSCPFLFSCRFLQTPTPNPVHLPVKGRKPLFDYLQVPRWRQGTNGKAVFLGRFRGVMGSDSTSKIRVWVGLV